MQTSRSNPRNNSRRRNRFPQAEKPAQPPDRHGFSLPWLLCLLFVAFGLLVLSENTTRAEDQSPPTETTAANRQAETTAVDPDKDKLDQLYSILLKSEDNFVYRTEGRSDPFKPFVTEKQIREEHSAELEELTGMQRFEPGQLSLVAIVSTKDGPLAMVEDSAGKGYVLRKGMKIGRSGEIVAIQGAKVQIKESYQSLTGQTQYKNLEMVLRKEGERNP